MKGGEFMCQKLSHEEFVDIIDILYIKTFRLKNSWDFLSLFIFNGNMENRYPDLTYSLKYSFGIDAYTSINALFSSGKYSIPRIKWNRNKLFCHFAEKQSEKEIDEIVLHFPPVFDILADLTMKAMKLFNVNASEIRAIPEEKYRKLQEEKKAFSRLLTEGLLNDVLRQHSD